MTAEVSETRLANFWARVAKGRGCWEWQGPLNAQGYGAWRHPGLRISQAYRAAYLFTYGYLPAPGMHLDHVCRNRACVRPDHLQPVTPRENLLRSPVSPASIHAGRTHCPRGHPYSGDNLRVYRNMRYCRACNVDHIARTKANRPTCTICGRRPAYMNRHMRVHAHPRTTTKGGQHEGDRLRRGRL